MKYIFILWSIVLILTANSEDILANDTTFLQLNKFAQRLIREDVKKTEFTFRIQGEEVALTLNFPLNDAYHKHPWHRLVLGDQENRIHPTASGFHLLTVKLSNKGLRLGQKKINENVFRSEVIEMRDDQKLCFLVIVEPDEEIKEHLSLLKFIEAQSDGRWLLQIQ
jgi:hypothetical protein